LEIFSQLTHFQKVQLFQIVKLRPEIEVHSQELQEHQLLSLVTQMMERKPELDFQVEAEEPFQVTAELWLEYAPVVVELTSQS
jgi:hypothetical protein